MSDTVLQPKPPASGLLRNLLLYLPAVLLFVALMAFSIWQANRGSRQQYLPNGVPMSPEIEEKFGVQFTGVYVVAEGGLVDLRYRVVDAGKANNFGHYSETSPMLIAEEDGAPVEVTIMGMHNHRVETGRNYYVLYRNTKNALHPGDTVTIQIGDYRLEHVQIH